MLRFREWRTTNPDSLRHCAILFLKMALRSVPDEGVDGERDAGYLGGVWSASARLLMHKPCTLALSGDLRSHRMLRMGGSGWNGSQPGCREGSLSSRTSLRYAMCMNSYGLKIALLDEQDVPYC